MKLHELSAKYEQLYQLTDSVEEEVFEDTLQAIKEPLQEKAINIAKLILTWDDDISTLDNEIKRLQMLKKSIQSRQNRTKEYLLFSLNKAGIKKINDIKYPLMIRNNTKINVYDFSQLPDKFIRYKPGEPDKVAIKNAIKEKETVPGAEIIDTQTIKIG
ncbi:MULTISPECIES: siphovirus Gp157 family protein [Listeria]|uniref:siphovirus Gp157 family protein n=1 Tax=Listeria TaxID=1637 RepID=UPI000B5949E1|nr:MULTISPECIES: siphovirus Gp157 family protein [Listeria]